MIWTAPDSPRTDPPQLADERAMLDGWLDYHRATLLIKCSGLTGEQLARRATPPSSMSLLGLLRHLSDVERIWFHQRLRGETRVPQYWTDEYPDGDFDLVDPARAEADHHDYLTVLAEVRAVAATHELTDTFVHPRDGEMSVRWLYLHLIEEYARHNGHADLLRQAIDGAVGE
jgi:uncharacterized damage-inducible protein DinB